jgi:hypothetical protein
MDRAEGDSTFLCGTERCCKELSNRGDVAAGVHVALMDAGRQWHKSKTESAADESAGIMDWTAERSGWPRVGFVPIEGMTLRKRDAKPQKRYKIKGNGSLFGLQRISEWAI